MTQFIEITCFTTKITTHTANADSFFSEIAVSLHKYESYNYSTRLVLMLKVGMEFGTGLTGITSGFKFEKRLGTGQGNLKGD